MFLSQLWHAFSSAATTKSLVNFLFHRETKRRRYTCSRQRSESLALQCHTPYLTHEHTFEWERRSEAQPNAHQLKSHIKYRCIDIREFKWLDARCRSLFIRHNIHTNQQTKIKDSYLVDIRLHAESLQANVLRHLIQHQHTVDSQTNEHNIS